MTRSLKHHVVATVLAALLPVILLAFGLTWALVTEKKAAQERGQLERLRAISLAVDIEVERTVAALQALALNDALGHGDLRAFYSAATRARELVNAWDNVLLLSPTAEHLMNLRRPWGESLPPLNEPPNVLDTASSSAPVISNVIRRGAVYSSAFVAISVPVMVEGRLKYVLLATISSDYWSRWLVDRTSADHPVAIIDREQVILARSMDAEKTVGSQVQGWYKAVLSANTEGVVRGPGLVNADVQATFVRSARTGWAVNLVTPGSAVDRPIRVAALTLLGGCAAALAIALALGFWRARRLTRGVSIMRAALEGLRLQEPQVEQTPTGVAEMDAALQVAAATGEDLQDRGRRIKGLRKSLLARVDAAEAEARRKDEFVATLAHELRNPLAPISTSVEILKRRSGTGVDAASKHAMEVIERQLRHMTRLVDDLLDVSRINTGKVRLHKDTVELRRVVQLALEAAAPMLEQAELQLEVDYPREPLYVLGDETRLVQVVVNLLSNAAKFTPKGGHVAVVLSSGDDVACIRVRDNGIGLEPADVSRIFEMFSQVQPAVERVQGGLGIGLALVRGLILAHGGTVTASSDGPGRGAEFVIRLSLSRQPAVVQEAVRAPAPASAAERGLRILVADDNPDIVESLGRLLQMMGHEVMVANDGLEALDKALRLLPDVALLDIGMPGLTGHELCRRIRASQNAKRMRLVAISGWGRKEDLRESLEAGFDDHLVKPVDVTALEDLLSKAAANAT